MDGIYLYVYSVNRNDVRISIQASDDPFCFLPQKSHFFLESVKTVVVGNWTSCLSACVVIASHLFLQVGVVENSDV